jgi:hypothetical protein
MAPLIREGFLLSASLRFGGSLFNLFLTAFQTVVWSLLGCEVNRSNILQWLYFLYDVRMIYVRASSRTTHNTR